ncbi:MAG: tyrosine-type recombinase/integrase [Terracidiphilus sp.]|jgi:site-specific recombinase XerD
MRLSQAIETYIAYKRSLGNHFRSDAVRLRAFVKAVGNLEMGKIQPRAVRRFLDGKGPVTSFWFSKYHTLSGFYHYAIARHYVRRSPLPRSRPQQPEKFQAYIYTNDDMRKLIDAADSRHRYVWILTPDTIRTLLLLLYGTGLRISEALRLNISDFDRDSGVLTIRETKFFKSRFVPVGHDLCRLLEAYIDRQWSPAHRTGSTPILGTVKYQRITRQTAELVYKRVREEAGVHRSPKARFQPRLHDFRHTFAVVRLVTWYREGKNVQRLLPHLTTYLGHGTMKDTARYLAMTTELLEQASLCFERYARPEVSHD